MLWPFLMASLSLGPIQASLLWFKIIELETTYRPSLIFAAGAVTNIIVTSMPSLMSVGRLLPDRNRLSCICPAS